MQQMQGSIHIDAPVEHVWAFYLDTSHWPDWMPGGRYSDFSGPLDEVGTTYVGGMRIMGHEMKATYEVVEIVPQRLYHERTDMGPQENYLRFEPEGGGTLMSYEMNYEMPAHLPRFLTDLLNKGWMERHTRQMLEDFKALAELRVAVPA